MCDLLGYEAARSCNFLPTFLGKNIGPIFKGYSLRTNPEERSFQVVGKLPWCDGGDEHPWMWVHCPVLQRFV
jgi:hypothetical protein